MSLVIDIMMILDSSSGQRTTWAYSSFVSCFKRSTIIVMQFAFEPVGDSGSRNIIW